MNDALKPDIIYLLSVDTEEEWDWSGEFPQKDFAVDNVQLIPKFQSFCQSLGIRPTYFTDYAVLENADAIKTLQPLAENNLCEIGAHLHPWCNPPYFGETGEKESHVVNLPLSQVEQKLDALIELLNKSFGVMPNAFRTGRWGINGEVLTLLEKKGFQIDSSMYPLFKNEYFDCEKTGLDPYWPDYDNPIDKGPQRNILEIPVTVGFNHNNFDMMLEIYNFITKPFLSFLHLTGIFWETRLLRKLYLSPEVTSGKDMLPLIDFALNNKHPVIHMYLHSSSLIDDATGFMKDKNAFELICKNIEQVINYTKTKANVKFCTISEAASILQHRNTNQ